MQLLDGTDSVEGAGEPLDAPPAYGTADAVASVQQRRYGRLLRAHLVLLVLAAAAAGSTTSVGHLAAPVLLLFALALRYTATRCRDEWQRSRALAERIVSLMWLHVLRVPPFERDADADTTFRERCTAVAASIPGAAGSVSSSDIAPTPEMRELRNLADRDRVRAYVGRRLDEQRIGYYRRKLPFLRGRARLFRAIVMVGTLLAVLVLAAQAGMEWEPDAGGVLVAALASTEAWVASRRYEEFARLYERTFEMLGRQRRVLVEAVDSGPAAQALHLAAECEQTLALEQVEWLGMLSLELSHRLKPEVRRSSKEEPGRSRRLTAGRASQMLAGADSYTRVGVAVSARRLRETTHVKLDGGATITGEAGDWLVDGPGGSRVVARDLFDSLYEQCADGTYRSIGTVVALRLNRAADVETREGWVHANPGDWLVRGPSGECWTVSPEHFEAGYAQVRASA